MGEKPPGNGKAPAYAVASDGVKAGPPLGGVHSLRRRPPAHNVDMRDCGLASEGVHTALNTRQPGFDQLG